MLRLAVKFSVNAIVQFEEWLTVSIIRVGSSRRGVKTSFVDYQELQNKLWKALLFNEAIYGIFILTQCLLFSAEKKTLSNN